jgi:hypothetical protein
MKRLGLCAALAALAFVLPASAQTQAPPPGQIATPSDYILLTVIMRHHQTMNLGEISKILEEQGFSTKFPPEGIQVESWYAAMGLGHVVTLRVPPARSSRSRGKSSAPRSTRPTISRRSPGRSASRR